MAAQFDLAGIFSIFLFWIQRRSMVTLTIPVNFDFRVNPGCGTVEFIKE